MSVSLTGGRIVPSRYMQAELVDRLRCPRCRGERVLEIHATAADEQEIRAGMLRCGSCGEERGIVDGIVDMLHDPPEFVVREAEGLGRFAQFMRDDGWTRDSVLELPHRNDGYWFCQAML